MAKFKTGDHVIIYGSQTVLQNSLDYEGGWKVAPAVQNCRYWNEDAMAHETEGEELVRRLRECDAAMALCNEAARFIEGMLKNG